MNLSPLQVPLDLTRQPEVNHQQQQQPQQQPPAPVEQPPKPNPVEQPKAPAPVATQPPAAAVAVAPPPQAKPAGYAAIAASNTAPAGGAAPGIPTNSALEPPADSFTSIGEWNQVKYITFELHSTTKDIKLSNTS